MLQNQGFLSFFNPAALKRMLNLNASVSKASVPSEPVWKVSRKYHYDRAVICDGNHVLLYMYIGGPMQRQYLIMCNIFTVNSKPYPNVCGL